MPLLYKYQKKFFNRQFKKYPRTATALIQIILTNLKTLEKKAK